MKFDIGDRQTGKSTRIIDWAREDDRRRLIVFNHKRARQIEKDHPILEGRVISVNSLASLRGHDIEIGIDDLESVLPQLLGTGRSPVSYVTATEAT
jgi:hypothetical protein